MCRRSTVTDDPAPINDPIDHSSPLLSLDVPNCVPADSTSRAAFKHAQQHLHPAVLNHSIRVYLHARSASKLELATWKRLDPSGFVSHVVDQPSDFLLFTACIMHDIGTSDAHDGDQRFEVEGADAAAKLLHDMQVSETCIQEVWTAIALHNSAGIAERMGPLTRLVRFGVSCDFGKQSCQALLGPDKVAEVERTWPRLDIEKVLGDAVVEQVLRHPEEKQAAKAPSSTWPGCLVQAKKDDREWDGINKAF